MTAKQDPAAAAEGHMPGDDLRGREYERLGRVLGDLAHPRCEDARLSRIVDAAYQLFDTCHRYRAEQQEHLQAYFSANRRELELLRDLRGLIDLATPAQRLPSPDLPEVGSKAASATAATSAAEASGEERVLAPPCPRARRPPEPAHGVVEQAADAELESSMHAAGAADAPSGDTAVAPTLDVYFLSPFQVLRDDRPITDWPNSKGKSLFKYLVANRERPVPKEVLMDVFWPGADAHAARNNLNVAIYGLRKELGEGGPAFPYILFQEGCYLLNPALRIWVDAEAFREHREEALRLEKRGELEPAIQQYRAAEVLYQQAFLAEDRYEAWVEPLRQSLEQAYTELLDRLAQHDFEQKDYDSCALVCRRMLGADACNEAPHRLLMRCYARLGQPHLALRQFHVCVESLARELKLYPTPQTVDLFRRVRNQQPV